MKARVCALLLVILPSLLGVDLLRASNKNIEQGNAKLLDGQAQEALQLYDKALAEDGLSDPQARAAAEFNRGAALAALKQNDEAAQAFLEATKSKDVSLRARAFYNLGNTFFQGEKFSEAVEAYKRSLVLDPKNADAKWNLELALRRKRDQDEQNKKNDQDKNEQDKQNQDKQNQDNQDQDKDQGKQDQNKQDQNEQDQNEQDQGEQNQDQQNQDEQDKQDSNEQDQKPGQDPAEPDPNQEAANENDKGSDEQQPQPNDPSNEPPQPQPEQTEGPEQNKASQAESADMKEINAILDSLEQSPQEMERQRARMRAVRRRPPVKDW